MTSRFNTTSTMGKARRSVNISMKYLSRKENKVVKESSKNFLSPESHLENPQNKEDDNRDKQSIRSLN